MFALVCVSIAIRYITKQKLTSVLLPHCAGQEHTGEHAREVE